MPLTVQGSRYIHVSVTVGAPETVFDSDIDEIVAADPDAIILITFDEGSRILKTMVEKGIGPQNKMVYGCDGNMGNALGENFNAGK